MESGDLIVYVAMKEDLDYYATGDEVLEHFVWESDAEAYLADIVSKLDSTPRHGEYYISELVVRGSYEQPVVSDDADECGDDTRAGTGGSDPVSGDNGRSRRGLEPGDDRGECEEYRTDHGNIVRDRRRL